MIMMICIEKRVLGSQQVKDEKKPRNSILSELDRYDPLLDTGESEARTAQFDQFIRPHPLSRDNLLFSRNPSDKPISSDNLKYYEPSRRRQYEAEVREQQKMELYHRNAGNHLPSAPSIRMIHPDIPHINNENQWSDKKQRNSPLLDENVSSKYLDRSHIESHHRSGIPPHPPNKSKISSEQSHAPYDHRSIESTIHGSPKYDLESKYLARRPLEGLSLNHVRQVLSKPPNIPSNPAVYSNDTRRNQYDSSPSINAFAISSPGPNASFDERATYLQKMRDLRKRLVS